MSTELEKRLRELVEKWRNGIDRDPHALSRLAARIGAELERAWCITELVSRIDGDDPSDYALSRAIDAIRARR